MKTIKINRGQKPGRVDFNLEEYGLNPVHEQTGLPDKFNLTTHDFADKSWLRSIVPNLKRDIGVIAGSAALVVLALGFAYGVRGHGKTCEQYVEEMDQQPKKGYLVQKGDTLYGLCADHLGVPEECLSSCSRYLAGLNGMNPDNPKLKAGENIGVPNSFK